MKIGLVFPQTEYGGDPIAVRDYAQTAEALGYSHLLAYDHVLGANPDRPGGFTGPYTYLTSFLEPFVLFAYMAAFTRSLEFCTAILILPQRQTALVAKQAATLDRLCQGRLRLGVGLGWNPIEYDALGKDFHTRGRRFEEQVELLRRLWTEPLVKYQGRWERVDDAGLNPLPVQQPIPLWFGGSAPRVIDRTARLADGWIAPGREPAAAKPLIERLCEALAAAGRAKSAFGIEVRMLYAEPDPSRWRSTIDAWQKLGVTHLSLNTMGCGLERPGDHLRAVRHFAEALGLTPGGGRPPAPGRVG
ncbi:MAG: LLM class F420-dependent oxidoreductase [Chloroflexi bacterium RBG_16_64_43]|nr:MAG: LLM class F420-dependent oxidoreductase [Chloroflexi bacterium RBG_16_64_43]